MNKKDAIKMAVAYYVHVVVPIHSQHSIYLSLFYILLRCEKIVRVGLSFGSRSYLTAPMYPSLLGWVT